LPPLLIWQFAEFFGFDKDCNGQYINSTLSRVQQWAHGIYVVAQDLVGPGYHCNNPAKSIIAINAVDGLHDKKWAKTADRDLLEMLDKIHFLKLKILRKVFKEMLILVTGKYQKCIPYHHYISFDLHSVFFSVCGVWH